MELNSYQREVMADLKSYLACVKAEDDLEISWRNYWAARGKTVGFGGVPSYNNQIPRVPHICIKVPTGGGKTFLACAALQPIYQKLLSSNKKIVVWLVPSEAILTQTIAALSDINHAYRKRIEQDFQSNVEVYTKEMLLQAQNISASSINESLSICVLSYDSIRANKKEGRRVYRENGALAPLAEKLNIDETALINILQELSPLVVVDESHNATSELSIEMLQNLNPSFILELTATPKNSSNVISYVNARDLKAENMVKLPVIVYKKNTRQQVITDAIAMRNKLEMQAEENFKNGGKYIRPIILFQAQPKGNDDNTTFEEVKKILIKMGIAENEIAIKTSTKNELEKVNLLSQSCNIRYIITVNALKEGWDCPFGYILASLANKNSQTDVEQIVGRILRQPYATRQSKTLLNLAYVFSCYKNFNETIDKIVAGMKFAGFSKNECRAAPEPPPQENFAQEEFQLETETSTSTATETDDFSDINAEEIKDALRENISENENDDAAQAISQAEEFENIFKGGDNVQVLRGENKFAIRDEFKESVEGLKIPQFFREVTANLFEREYVLLEKEHLSEKFTLDKQDANINFSISPDDLYKIDIYEEGDALPQYKKIIGREREQFINYLETLPSKNKINQCVMAITQIINNNTGIASVKIKPYVRKVIDGMDEGKISVISRQYQFYASRIQQKIISLQEDFRKKTFSRWLDTGEIICQNSFELPPIIDAPKNIDSIPKSLYAAEVSDMNTLERRMIDELITFENVKWWHRNISRKEFKVNGFINHYPDFMIMMNSGKILMIETKGDDRDNSDSKEKLELGRKWQARAGLDYKYFMVFGNNKINADGAYNFEEFLDVVSEL